jgi:hypothetical protein
VINQFPEVENSLVLFMQVLQAVSERNNGGLVEILKKNLPQDIINMLESMVTATGVQFT